MAKPFTKEQNKWLVDNLPKYNSYAELTIAFNSQFGTKYTWTRDGYNPIERRCTRMGLRRYSTTYGFTKDEDDWLRKYAPKYSNHWLSKNIVSVSGRKHSESAIKTHIRKQLDIHKGNGGIREDTVQTYKKPIGSIGPWGKHVRIKIEDTGDDKKDWYSYGRYVYENYYNVKLPDDYQVMHLDGNYNNFDIKNLCPVNHREHAILTANGWHSSGELTRTAVMWAMLSLLVKE